MNEFIIGSTLQVLAPLVSLYSLFIFLRGHNSPGGGFIGGLLLALGSILWIIAIKESKVRIYISKYFVQMISFCVLGLSLVAVAPLFFGKNLLEGFWTSISLPLAGKLSSILVFDFFIYLIIAISTVSGYIIFITIDGENN